MSPAELDRHCAEAMRRLTQSINRCAGQHSYHIRKAFTAARAGLLAESKP